MKIYLLEDHYEKIYGTGLTWTEYYPKGYYNLTEHFRYDIYKIGDIYNFYKLKPIGFNIKTLSNNGYAIIYDLNKIKFVNRDRNSKLKKILELI